MRFCTSGLKRCRPSYSADPGAVRAVRQPLPADIIGGLADVLPADDDVGPLRAFVSLVAVQRDGFFVDLDLLKSKPTATRASIRALRSLNPGVHST